MKGVFHDYKSYFLFMLRVLVNFNSNQNDDAVEYAEAKAISTIDWSRVMVSG